MNNKTAILKGLIEKMVSNEVKKQLPILLEELLTNPSNNTSIPKPVELTSRTSTLKEILEDKEVSNVKPAPTQKQTKKYSSNPMINSILNSTVNDLSLRESGRAVPSVGLDGQIGMSARIEDLNESIISQPQYNNTKIEASNVSSPVIDSVLDLKGQSEAVDNLMKWDFSAILKKSMKK